MLEYNSFLILKGSINVENKQASKTGNDWFRPLKTVYLIRAFAGKTVKVKAVFGFLLLMQTEWFTEVHFVGKHHQFCLSHEAQKSLQGRKHKVILFLVTLFKAFLVKVLLYHMFCFCGF